MMKDRGKIKSASPSEDEGLCRAKSRQRRCCFSLRSKEPLVFARGCDQILPAALLPRRFAPRLLFGRLRSEEHTSELQSLMRISYAVFCLKKKIIEKRI